jgi:septal ring factor EnvC (AmiA/AmiB activator)
MPPRHRSSLAALALLGLALGVAEARAQEPPPTRQLQQTREEIEASRQRHASLKKNLEQLESDLGGLQKETGSIAEALKKTQQQQHEIEQRLAALEKEATQKQSAIDRRRREIAALLATVLRVSQVPPQAVLAMENGLEAQIHASRALGITTQSLKQETDALSVELRELASLKEGIAREQQALAVRQETLEGQRKALAGRVEERRRSMESLHTEEMQEQERIAQLTRQSKDLEALVSSLEEARTAQRDGQFGAIGLPRFKPARGTAETRTASRPVPPTRVPKGERRKQEYDLAKARGALALPVAGTISGRYGQQQASNDTLKGLLLATPTEAVVTTPYGGEVMFTGPFRDYGQMVIIRHNKRYHTLLAGLSRIDVAPGQFLLEGEPIGAMGKAQMDRRLYVELREDGKAVDPAPWFGGARRLARN